MEAEKNLRKEISEKLKDETLRDALGRFSEAYPIARAKAYENAGDIETLRDALRQMKIGTVARIGEVADRFEAEATKRGVKVFRASIILARSSLSTCTNAAMPPRFELRITGRWASQRAAKTGVE